MIVVPAEPAPEAAPPATSSGEKTTWHVTPVKEREFVDSFSDATIIFSSYAADDAAFDSYIHEPR